MSIKKAGRPLPNELLLDSSAMLKVSYISEVSFGEYRTFLGSLFHKSKKKNPCFNDLKILFMFTGHTHDWHIAKVCPIRHANLRTALHVNYTITQSHVLM